VYQSLLHLTWLDKLLDNIRIIFVDLYKDQLKKPHTSIVECDFDGYFDQQVKELEAAAEKNPQRAPQIAVDDLTPPSSSDSGHDMPPPPLPGLAAISQGGQLTKPQANGDSTDVTPIPTPDTSRPSTPASHILAGKAGPKSRRAKKALNAPANASSGDERKGKPKKDMGKKMRRWDADGMADEDDGVVLDYSMQSPEEYGASNVESSATVEAIDSQSFGTRTGKGQFVLKDLEGEVHSILDGANEKKSQSTSSKGGVVGSSLGAISGLFRNVIGGKVLTKEDLAKPIRGMEEHLLKKNVAREAAVRLCEGVERELIGVKTGSFESMSIHYFMAFDKYIKV
jgi:signal recognition particle receptor subunit alpha